MFRWTRCSYEHNNTGGNALLLSLTAKKHGVRLNLSRKEIQSKTNTTGNGGEGDLYAVQLARSVLPLIQVTFFVCVLSVHKHKVKQRRKRESGLNLLLTLLCN